MELKPEELSSVIKKQIQNYKVKLETAETGTVIQVADGISRIHGLENAMQGELLLFPNDIYGMVMNLEEDNVGAVLLGETSKVKEGDLVKTTGMVATVPVGDAMLGRVVNALGQPIDDKGPIETSKTRPIERVAPGVITRAIPSTRSTSRSMVAISWQGRVTCSKATRRTLSLALRLARAASSMRPMPST